MRCLYCGKELTLANEEELRSQWHTRCVRKFFGTSQVPELNIDDQQLEVLAEETVSKGLTVPGVQKKLSLHLSREDHRTRLTVVDYPTGYILKPQTEEFPYLPEFEHLAMRMAEIAGIQTVPYSLMHTDHGYAYITKRIDRRIEKNKVQKFAMEDFCQLGLRQTADKYRGSYEQCVKIIRKYSGRTGLDLSELLIRILFSFIIGNSDMHLKNFSLIEDQPGSRDFHLSAAYDLLPVNLLMPEDQEELALTLNGKKQNLRRKDFLILAELCGLQKKNGEKIIQKICSFKDRYDSEIDQSYLPEHEKEALKDFIQIRIQRLNPDF